MSTGNQPGRIACPHCQAMIKAPALAAGSVVNCPKCGHGFRLGEGSGVAVQGSGGTVQGSKSNVQGREPGREEVQGPRSKVQGRPQSVPVPPPPPRTPSITSGEPRPSAAVPGRGVPSPQFSVPSTQAAASNPQSAIRNPQSPSPKPKSRSPDTVDPNLLAPPPPRVKPKPTEVAVICQLCGTRTYAKLDKIGQSIKCPDCHTLNEVPALREAAGPKQPAGPSLEGVEDYGMSEVVERPKYRPLQAPRGEYDVLSALDPASIEHRLTAPGDHPRTAATAVEAPPDAENEEVVLAPPAERVELGPDPTRLLPQPEMEPEDALYDGRYDDGVIGDRVDPRAVDAWKRAPFVYGIVEFLFYPSALVRWVAYAIGMALLVNFGRFVVESAMSMDLIAPIVIPFFCACCICIIAPFFAALYAIVQDTANGQAEVTAWPDWNVVEWMGKGCYFPWAMFLTCFPGILGIGLVLLSGLDLREYAFVAALPLVLTWFVLLPPALFSMLAENSLMALMSPQTIRSFKIASDAWMMFYLYSLVLFLLLTGTGSLVALDNFFAAAAGACGIVVILFVYARLIGRLMWYFAEKEAALSPVTAGHPAAVR